MNCRAVLFDFDYGCRTSVTPTRASVPDSVLDNYHSS